MKFQCDRCKTRYSIADEKVRGKVLKIRCKNCETVITVREGMEAPVGVSGRTMAFPAITGDMPTPAALTGKPVVAPAPAPVTTIVPQAAAPPATSRAGGPAPDTDEWFVSIDGNQEGPFTLAQARDRVGKRRPGQEMHAWKDDFADWLPVDKVRELAPYLPKRPAPPPPPRPQARRSASFPAIPIAPPASGPTPTSVAGPMPVAPAAAAPPAAEPPPAAKPAFDFSVPAAPPPAAAPQPSHAPVPQPVHAVMPPAADDGLDFAISEPSRVARLHPPAGKNGSAQDSLSFPVGMLKSQPSMSMSMSIPVQHKRPVVLYLSGLLALIAMVVVVIVVLTSRGKQQTPAAAEGGEASDYIADVYKGGKVAPDRPGPGPAVPPSKTIEMPTQTPEPTKRTNVGKTRPANGAVTPDPLGKEETFPTERPREDTIEPLSPDDVIAMYRANETGLKWCYERALKEDPTFSMNKVSVTITVERSGAVSKISLPDQAASLGTCLNSRIRGWRFRKSTEGINMQFDILFARN